MTTTTRYTRHHRPEFDPGASYVAAREFLLGGVTLAPGDPVDRGAVDDRRLRQLCDQGRIKRVPGTDTRRVVARRRVTIGGKDYAPGDRVPREAIVSEQRLSQLIARGDLGLEAGPVPRAVPRRARLAEGTSQAAE